MMSPRRLPSRTMASTVASSTPVKAPFQPAWAAPMTRASASANSTGPQSAWLVPSAMPGRRVTRASASGLSCHLQGSVTSTTSGEWT